MRVVQVIQGIGSDPPTEVQFYDGDDPVQALAAMVMAAAHGDTEWYSVKSVTLTF